MSGAADRVTSLLPAPREAAGELLSALQAWALAADRTLLFGSIGALMGIGSVLGLYALVRLVVTRRAPGGARSARVSALAARGATPAEIARLTGLSRDAVGMLLHGCGGEERQNRPLAARIAAPGRRHGAAARRVRNRQVVGTRRDAFRAPPALNPAHRLLDALSRSLRLSREQRLA